jgi:hypothetical protein
VEPDSAGGGQNRLHRGELFPSIGFVVTNSRLPAGKVLKVYNGRAEIENRSKEGKNTRRRDKTPVATVLRPIRLEHNLASRPLLV